MRREADLAEQKENEKFLKELAPELKSLDKHADANDVDFLKFLYENFKPSQSGTLDLTSITELEKRSAEWNNAVKKLLQKSIVHYHPDRVRHKESKLRVLHLKITQHLTRRYERRKSD